MTEELMCPTLLSFLKDYVIIFFKGVTFSSVIFCKGLIWTFTHLAFFFNFFANLHKIFVFG